MWSLSFFVLLDPEYHKSQFSGISEKNCAKVKAWQAVSLIYVGALTCEKGDSQSNCATILLFEYGALMV